MKTEMFILWSFRLEFSKSTGRQASKQTISSGNNFWDWFVPLPGFSSADFLFYVENSCSCVMFTFHFPSLSFSCLCFTFTLDRFICFPLRLLCSLLLVCPQCSHFCFWFVFSFVFLFRCCAFWIDISLRFVV